MVGLATLDHGISAGKVSQTWLKVTGSVALEAVGLVGACSVRSAFPPISLFLVFVFV